MTAATGMLRSPPLASSLAQWSALHHHALGLKMRHLRDLFRTDPLRGERLTAEAAGLYLDYSKQRVTDETLRLLLELAEACGLNERIAAMFQGERINTSESRPAMHVALRAPASADVEVEGKNVVPEVQAVLNRMTDFVQRLVSGALTGHTGQRIRNVVNIGIGGSDLGPLMAYKALRHYSRRDIQFRFVSNVDGADFVLATQDLNPAETLFVICSKTFSTLETLTNAKAARDWCLRAFGSENAIAKHFVAVSANTADAVKFGIDPNNCFGFWDWVGGRYSMESAIGLSTMAAIGPANFRALLAGFHAMDGHFQSEPWQRNLPVLMGLLAVWNGTFLGIPTAAVLPYSHYLDRFPAYLQQLAMESNGKHVTRSGRKVDYATSAVYWGESGTNAQHSFFQLLHQGTQWVACDFIGFCRTLNPLDGQHDMLMANLFAQTEALAFGKTAGELKAESVADALLPHRICEGNQPSNTLLVEKLTPFSLGALVALYEHSIFVQGVIWGIDSFDQWGVELGKVLAEQTAREISQKREPTLHHDSSTNTLIERYRRLRGNRA